MALSLAINARFQHRRITGVDRYAHEISSRLELPKRFIKSARPLGQVSGHVWEQFILPALLQKDERLWSPANSGAWSVSNQIVTIHDASLFDHPEWFRPAFGAWTRLSWKILAQRVKAILTVSEFSKQRLKHHLGIPDEKIHVIYNGVGKPFAPKSAKEIKVVREKYGIKKPYFLFVGTLEPRKNLKSLLSAWEQLSLKTHELFLAGAEGRVFSSTSHAKCVTTPPDQDLSALYSGATAFIFPSFYEGFGLPVLEAMSCGTPVITSNTTALAETYQDSAILINPEMPEEIARAMQCIIADGTLSNSLRERGLKKASELTWDKSAQKTQAMLESAA
ncbi:MAG: glycosyltransferase family 1 protein [Anaerolineales bacterium]|nr:glycosyltransferase family 1 protein [Anaerolineales bacterium]